MNFSRFNELSAALVCKRLRKTPKDIKYEPQYNITPTNKMYLKSLETNVVVHKRKLYRNNQLKQLIFVNPS